MSSLAARADIAGEGEAVVSRNPHVRPIGPKSFSQFQTGDIRQVMVQDQAFHFSHVTAKNLGCRFKGGGGITHYLQQHPQRIEHGTIVIDYCDHSLRGFGHGYSFRAKSADRPELPMFLR
jgi:hypothetical protein